MRVTRRCGCTLVGGWPADFVPLPACLPTRSAGGGGAQRQECGAGADPLGAAARHKRHPQEHITRPHQVGGTMGQLNRGRLGCRRQLVASQTCGPVPAAQLQGWGCDALGWWGITLYGSMILPA